jgi:PAS domain S-box-containing protein
MTVATRGPSARQITPLRRRQEGQPKIEITIMSLSTNHSNLEVVRLVVEQAPDAIIFADREGMIQVWNQAAADLFGFPADDVIGLSLDIIIPEHLRHAHWDGFGRAVALGHTKHGNRALKTRATHKDGKRLYVSLAFSIVNDPDGKVIGAMATARKFIEDDPEVHQLHASEKREKEKE